MARSPLEQKEVLNSFAHFQRSPLVKTESSLRIALYSHDTMGLGHKRRNLLIAQTLARSLPNSSIFLISGMEEGSNFDLPKNIDYLSLPAISKNRDGKYQPRRLGMSLQELISIRSEVIEVALASFNPDLFIVDNVPRGAVKELNPTLKRLSKQKTTKIVLGIRDILDEPSVTIQEWKNRGNYKAIEKYYDAIWVYGDPKVFDPVQEYQFPSAIAQKVSYTGYFDQRHRLQYNQSHSMVLDNLCLPEGKLILCMMGGGQDGGHLGQTFVQTTLPSDMNAIILTGPFMPPEIRRRIHHQVNHNPRLRVIEYLSEPTKLLARADYVISMGGYNTTCELLSFRKKSLIIPRVKPRLEQWIRAQRLEEMGWVNVLHPDNLSPTDIANWLSEQESSDMSNAPKIAIDMNGLKRLPAMILKLLGTKKMVIESINY